MIRHVVMFRWKDDFGPAERSDWLTGVRALPQHIEQVRSLSAGPDLLGIERSWDAAVVADFDSLADVAVYADHPAHRPLIEISGAGAEQIVSVDFSL